MTSLMSSRLPTALHHPPSAQMKSRGPDHVTGSPFVTFSPGYRALLVGGLWGYLALVGALTFFSGESSTVWIFLGLALNIVLLSIPLLSRRSALGWTHPVTLHILLVFLTAHLVRTPLYIRGMTYHLALPDWTRDDLARLVVYHLILSALALLAYYLGFFSRLCPPIPRLRFTTPKGVGWKAPLAIAGALAVFALYVQSQGGLSSHLLSWAEVGRVNAIRGEGHWLKLSRLGGLSALLWLAFDRRALYKPLFLAAGIACMAINFLGSGSRSSAIFLLVVGTLIWTIQRRQMVPLRALLVVGLCLLLLGSLGRLRRSLFSGEVNWSLLVPGEASRSPSIFAELHHRYGALDSLYPVLARVPSEEKLLYGYSYLTILALPIPRALWPDKPGTAGKLAGDLFFGVRAGIPPGAIGESYWNFHIPGVLLLFTLFGLFHRFMTSFLVRYQHQPAAVAIYALTVFWGQPSITAIAEWIYSMISVLALLWLGGAWHLFTGSDCRVPRRLVDRRPA